MKNTKIDVSKFAWGSTFGALVLGACSAGNAPMGAQTAAATQAVEKAGSGANAAVQSASSAVGDTIDTAKLQVIDKAPAEVLDLKRWKITLPFGEPFHPTEIKQPALENFKKEGLFYVTDKGVVFKAHAGGVTTPNSSYPRTELREMTSDGRKGAAWSTTQGRHTMMYTAAITGVPVAKPHVVAGQVHDANDDVIMVRLERRHLFVEGGGNNLGTLDEDYELGTPFDVIMDASGGRVRVYFNGESSPRVDIERKTDGCYFKLGAYTQSNPSKGDNDDAYGEVIVSKLAIHHND